MNTHNLMHSMNLQHVFCAGHRYKNPDQLVSRAHQRLHWSHNHLIKLLAGLRTKLILFSPLFIHHDFMHTHKFRTGNHTRNNISATKKSTWTTQKRFAWMKMIGCGLRTRANCCSLDKVTYRIDNESKCATHF